MSTNDFLPFANQSNYILDQTTFANSPTRVNGWSDGIAQTDFVNKVMRQSSIMAATLGQYIASKNYDAIDDGTTATLLLNFTNAVQTEVKTIAWGEGQTSAPWVSQIDLQNQSYISATTTGTAPTYVAALSLAPTLTSGLRARVKFHAATSASSTLNLNSTGAKSIKQYDITGAKVNAVITTGLLTDVEYDGVDWVVLNPLKPKCTQAGQLYSHAYQMPPVYGPSVRQSVTLTTLPLDGWLMINTANNVSTPYTSGSGISLNIRVNGVQQLGDGVLGSQTQFAAVRVLKGSSPLIEILTGNESESYTTSIMSTKTSYVYIPD